MIKVILDPAVYQTERYTGSSADLARRLEWRLQWEKAQVENWQTSSHTGGQQVDAAESPIETGERCVKETKKEFIQNRFASDKLPVVTEVKRFDRSDIYQSKLTVALSSPKHAKPPMAYTTISPYGTDGAVRYSSFTAKAEQTARATSMPQNQQSQPSGVHIYQADGKVEVALRNTGLKGMDGVMLMRELKKDLTSLGMKLTRLTLNGELLWQTETTTSKGLAFTAVDADEAPIDKIY